MSLHLPALILALYMVITVALGATLAGLWLILLVGAAGMQGRTLWRRYRR